jgi:septal ring factor EnvC (AmiA/AmiB activator)
MQIIEQIERTTEILNKTKVQKERTLAEAELLESRINNRTSLVEMTSREIQLVDQEIDQTAGKMEGIKRQIEESKKVYGELIREAYYQKVTTNTFVFYFSSTKLNAFFNRWRYLGKIKEACLLQIDLLRSRTLVLEQIVAQLKKDKADRNSLMKTELELQEALKEDLEKKDKWLKSLSNNEQALSKSLTDQRKARENLNRAIENVIIASLSAKKTIVLNKDESHFEALGLSSGGFEFNKGKLINPLSGKIVVAFGKQKHPVVPNVEIENKGIDIRGVPGDEVLATYDGTVVHRSHIAGQGSMIIIQHDNYYSVYSKLAQATVAKEQEIRAGEPIGLTFGHENEQAGILHFEIWKEQKQLNPTNWIR